jgi:hypothetical protein
MFNIFLSSIIQCLKLTQKNAFHLECNFEVLRKYLTLGPKGNSVFCGPETVDVSLN